MAGPEPCQREPSEDRSIMPVFIACLVSVLLIVLTTWKYVADLPRSAKAQPIAPAARPSEPFRARLPDGSTLRAEPRPPAERPGDSDRDDK